MDAASPTALQMGAELLHRLLRARFGDGEPR